ncbi:FAD-dependent monooxygenase [Kribbella solani]|uniref:3-(3-hydroxy-phenyl)propionate hydroxylase n=1 Tax=Kribbella solani TaxID=236067 RepID=A0A841DNQ6_9ACTN|nr:FAD-dependent monooxygenase [Kribbella solani]MBB5977098.1 3-(3-hydroxy-phenyl)propionate hydroxylase [Kribbella solani]
METTQVVIAGAGPTGLMLTAELRLAGIDVVLLDALPARSGESRAGGVHARTMELFDQRGLLDRMIERGRPIQAGHFAGIKLDCSDFPTRFPYTLAIVQAEIERELDAHAATLGVPVRWGSPVRGIRPDADGIEVQVGDSAGSRIRCEYLVGCDGGRSTVRKLAGISFDGTESTMQGMLADVELADPPAGPVFSVRRGPGDYSALNFQPGWYRLLVQRHDRVIDRAAEPTFEDFRESFREVAGTDFGMHSPRWVSQYGDAARQADRYRVGRVLLAGDAAHIHYPAGGQGLNTGVQDAVNLGWKLAAVVRGEAPALLLDTYESERHPVAARVLQNTRAQTALARPGAHSDALRETFTGLVEIDEVRQRLGLMITGLDIRYELAGDHPLIGRRVPDAELSTTRVHQLLVSGKPILLSLNGSEPPAIATGWTERLDCVAADAVTRQWTIPGAGDIRVPATVLIRPDGHVAWATDVQTDTGLEVALTTWLGPAAVPGPAELSAACRTSRG